MYSAARLTLAALALLTLVACGSSSTPEPADDAEAEADARALGRDTDKTVLDDMIQTQDRARAVEDVTFAHKEDLDKAIEASEGDAPADDE